MNRKTRKYVNWRSKKLLAAPIRYKKLSLDQLVAKISPTNRHREINWGLPVGKEI